MMANELEATLRALARWTLALTAVGSFGAGVLVTDTVRDQREAARWAEVAQERVFWAGQDACFPGPGQRAVQTWNGDHIDCVTYENWAPGLAPRAVLAFSMPALAQPLGGTP